MSNTVIGGEVKEHLPSFPAGRRYCGTVQVMGRAIDVYEVNLLEFSDGNERVAITREEAIGILTGETTLDWRIDSGTR